TDEPFMNMLIRGRDYRREHGKPIDHSREDAEVEGFAKIEQTLCSPDTAVGTMMISISPPGEKGSSYTHNFYDIFTLAPDKQGDRYIEARRYSSALSNEEYSLKATAIDK